MSSPLNLSNTAPSAFPRNRRSETRDSDDANAHRIATTFAEMRCGSLDHDVRQIVPPTGRRNGTAGLRRRTFAEPGTPRSRSAGRSRLRPDRTRSVGPHTKGLCSRCTRSERHRRKSDPPSTSRNRAGRRSRRRSSRTSRPPIGTSAGGMDCHRTCSACHCLHRSAPPDTSRNRGVHRSHSPPVRSWHPCPHTSWERTASFRTRRDYRRRRMSLRAWCTSRN